MTADELLNVLLLSPNATAVYVTEDFIIEMANDAMLDVWGKDRSVIGKPLIEGLPELIGQPFIKLLQEVWRTGTTYTTINAPAILLVKGKLQTFYFDYEYKAIKHPDGSTCCILNTATDVSERMNAEAVIAENEKQLQMLNQQLSETNVELFAGNKDLRGTNTTMRLFQNELQEINNRLIIIENRFAAITSSPNIFVSIIDENRNLFYVNDAFQRLTGRSPELFLQSGYIDLVHPADVSGFVAGFLASFENQISYAGEYRVMSAKGSYHTMSSNSAPVYAGGKFAGYISCATDITRRKQFEEELRKLNSELKVVNEEMQATNEELQTANEELQTANEELQATNEELRVSQDNSLLANAKLTESEEKFRLAIESSNLGTWYINAETREFIPSPRLKEMFGYYANEIMPYDAAVNQIREDYRTAVTNAVEAAIKDNKAYDIEYPVIGYHDNKLRWVRATGKLYKTDHNQTATFFGVIDDITERKQDEQRKNDFIGMVSHEMKTPLTSLSAYMQILESHAARANDAFSAGLLQKANKQAGKMNVMINSFLNVSRLESGKIEINNILFDMADLVKESEEETLSLYSTHNIIFHPVEPTPVSADKDKISQVINNLISNAVKYSPPKSTIQVSCITFDGMAKVCVSDEGIGIRQEDIPKLFERYYRVENKSTKSVSGFGIGLYLCAEIINRHGGAIWADSEEGQGSTFCFTIPVVK